MPRPLRIEYEDAFYHVMNRGRARNNIFFSEIHYETFIATLEDSCKRFNVIIHSYCLMSNHYHILLQTPHANLSRFMGHLNSIYTRRFNKLQKIDGPLFRGRYKAILVDSGEYLLELTKYIHRNPIQTKKKSNRLVNDLSDYKWSSYRSYLKLVATPDWLNKELTFSNFHPDKDLIKRYQLFVEREENVELEEFFKKKNKEAILGGIEFKEKIVNKELLDYKTKQDRVKTQMRNEVTVDSIIKVTSDVFKVSIDDITRRQFGRQQLNNPRAISMYLIQEYKDCKLFDIAKIFSLNNGGSVAKSIFKVKQKIKEGMFEKELKMIEEVLWLMERA